MTNDITAFDETVVDENEELDIQRISDHSIPPLCLIHYFGGTTVDPPEQNLKPPGSDPKGRIAERDGNLIILEFAPPPETVQAQWQKRRRSERIQSRISMPIFLLLLLTCFLGCLIAFRF